MYGVIQSGFMVGSFYEDTALSYGEIIFPCVIKEPFVDRSVYLMSVGLLPNAYLMTVSFLVPEIVYFKLNFAQNVTAMVANDTRILLSTVCEHLEE